MTPTNLPIQLTSFIGREGDLEAVERLFSVARLVTLSGVGGCGKTRLAIQLATKLSESFPDGMYFVDLAPLREPALVLQLIFETLGAHASPDQPALEVLLDYLRPKQLLIVLDNCEHISVACAQLVGQILSQTSSIRVLVTSREPLATAGEMIYPVPGLTLPPVDAVASGDPQDLMQFDAIRLFVERSRASVPQFAITSTNALRIVQICERLDGLPLALELASAHTNILSLQEILTRLDDRFALLVSRQRNEVDARHRTMRAAIDWSYDLLVPSEQALLRRLSVFAGGCSFATVEAVCTGEGLEQDQLLGLLSSLVNKSLVVSHTLQRDEARYSLLATIQQYGQEKLIDSGELPAIRDRHLQCFLYLTEETDTKLRGENQQLWLNWLDNEYDNLRGALIWSIEGGQLESDRVEAGLRITAGLYQFWRIRHYEEEGLSWCKQLFAETGDEISPVVRANALSYASLLAGIRGQIEDQMRFGEEAVHFGEAAGEDGKQALAIALGSQGYAARKMGDNLTAFTLAMREIQLRREVGDRYQLGVALSLGSIFPMSIGMYQEARAMLSEGLPLLREAADPFRTAMALNYTGDVARCEGNYQEAQSAYEESISILREINALGDLPAGLQNLGHACLHLGDIERAKALFSESMAAQQELGNRSGMIEGILGFAALAIHANLPGAGVRLLAAAAAIGGRQITSEWAATSMEYDHYLERAHASLKESAFRADQAAGQRMSLEQAIAYTQDVTKKVAAAQKTRQQLEQLTPRECEVATLIAKAKSNSEIAAELVVSKRTVETHIANIRAKLGVTERTQIVRWAIESGLVKSSE